MKLARISLLAMAIGSLGLAAVTRAQISAQRLSLEQAQSMIAAALEAASERDLEMSIAVVDRSGELVAFARTDGVLPAAVTVSQGKALTSARLRQPTSALEEIVNGGRTSVLGLFPEITPLGGGLPIAASSGEVIGGIGCSGASSQEDEQICSAGLAALSSR